MNKRTTRQRRPGLTVVLLAATAMLPVMLPACRPRAEESAPGGVRVSGTIETTEATLGFRIPGTMTERPVDEGEKVRAGQLLAKLDERDYAQLVAVKSAAVATARADLRDLEAGSRPEEIAKAKAALEQARADEAHAKSDFDRLKGLFADGFLSQQELVAVQTRYDAAGAAVRQAQEQYELVKKGPREETIAAARARLSETEAARDLAQLQLSYTRLTAAMSGGAVTKHAEPGEYLAVGAPVLTVADLDHVWLRGYVSETDLGRVKFGQRARVTADTYPGKVYEGRIAFISPAAEFTPRTVQTQKERVRLVYRIKIDIDNPNQELKPGMPADAEIDVDGGGQ